MFCQETRRNRPPSLPRSPPGERVRSSLLHHTGTNGVHDVCLVSAQRATRHFLMFHTGSDAVGVARTRGRLPEDRRRWWREHMPLKQVQASPERPRCTGGANEHWGFRNPGNTQRHKDPSSIVCFSFIYSYLTVAAETTETRKIRTLKMIKK